MIDLIRQALPGNLLTMPLILLLAVFSGPGQTLASPLCPTQPLDPSRQAIDPISAYCYLEDPQGALTPADILGGEYKLQPAHSGELVFPATRSRYWIYLELHNPANHRAYWYLQLKYPLLDEIELYQIGDNRIEPVRTGDSRAFTSRPVDYPYFLLPMALNANEYRQILISVRSEGALNIPLSLHQPDQLLAQASRMSLAQGIFYGALLILVLFNAVLFVATGKRAYFYNGFYMLCTGLFLFAMGGLAFQYLWPQLPWLANKAIPLSEALAMLSFTLFGRSFLEIDQRLPKAHRITRGLVAFSVLNTVLALIIPYEFAIKSVTLSALAAIAILYVIGLERWRQGYLPAKWYVLSWTLMVAGTLLYALGAFGYVADYLANLAVMQTAVAAQVLLLNYALALQVRYLSDRVLQVQKTAKDELLQQVDQRTRQLRTTMAELETANHKLTELSTRDQLTGLHNRRYFDAALASTFSEARRSGKPLALVMLDADHFKAVNDTFGHAVGDECLQHLAQVMQAHVRRPGDTLARIGGEEFAIVLSDTDREGAWHVAQSIRDSLARQPVLIANGSQVPLTLSAGIALGVITANSTVAELFQAADQALYEAKRKGRNRVEMSPPVS